jgi:uncharacterized protein YkwD
MKALRKFALVAMLLATVPSTATATAAPAADDPSTRMIEAINDVRAAHRLPPLREAPRLIGAASGQARSVIRSDSFQHGSSFRNAGFRTAGEAMAYNRGWSRRTRPAIRMWMNSPGHRALVLSRSFRYVGAGIARGRLGGTPTTIWVAQFGAH